MEGFYKISGERSSQKLFEELLDRIADGTYKAGERLPGEKELMRRYGKSHGTVRNALKMLEAAGCLRTVPGGGAAVTMRHNVLTETFMELFIRSRVTLGQLYGFVKLVEPELIRRYIQRFGQEESRALDRALVRLETAFSCEDPSEAYRQILKIHVTIVDCMKNPMCSSVFHAACNIWLYRLTSEERSRISVYGMEEMLQAHRLLIKEIKAGNGDAACEVYAEAIKYLFYDDQGEEVRSITYDDEEIVSYIYGLTMDSNVSVMAYCQILGKIIRGEYKAGDRLPSERELAKKMGISRPSLVEALATLEFRGHIRREQGRGTIVAPVNSRGVNNVIGVMYRRRGITFRDIFDLRAICEPISFSLAAASRTYNNVRDLTRIVDEAIEDSGNDIERYMSYGTRFDCKVAEICGNRMLYLVEMVVSSFTHQLLGSKLRKLEPHFAQQFMKQIYIEHSELIDFISVRDSDEVRILCEKHLKGIADAAF